MNCVILEKKGIEYNHNSEEVFTYTMEYIGSEICKKLKLHKSI